MDDQPHPLCPSWTDRYLHRAVALLAFLVIISLRPLDALAAEERPRLSSAVIRGSTVYTAADLFEVYRDYLGEPIDSGSARAIVQALAAKYERDGYSRPQVRVDDALIRHGVLRVEVIEPRISGLVIQGDPGPYRDRLEALGQLLDAEAAVRPGDVDALLRKMRALPGLTLGASTELDEGAPNTYRLGLQTQFEPFEATIRLTNRGTREIGPGFLLAQAAANGLLGGEARAGLLFATAEDREEYHGAGLQLDARLAPDTRITTSFFRSSSRPHETPLDLDDRYDRDRLSLRATRPLRSDGEGRAWVFAGLGLDDLTIERSGVSLRDERLRVLELGARWSWSGGEDTLYASALEVRKGLGGLGSGLDAADLSVDPRRADFLLVRWNLVRLTQLSARWSLRMDAFLQHTAYVLPYVERFKIGGDRLGRGFEVTQIAGDQGAGAKLEAKRSLGGLGDWGRAFVYGFYDLAAAWKQDAGGRESAATAGIGVALEGRRLTGYSELAQPLTHEDVEGSDEMSLFFGVTARL